MSQREIYIKVIDEEKHKTRLLAHCQKYTASIASYHKVLLPEYKNEVAELFVNYIRQCASSASSRNSYATVCNLIVMCENACPGATAKVRAEITQKYARRPAFMEEMRKIGN